MKSSYESIDDFIRDIKLESVRETVINMGYLTEDDFKGSSKVNCLFHSGDRTPSLQITDNFFKCYGCSAKGDLIKFIQLKDMLSFQEAVEKLSDFFNVTLNTKSFQESNEKRAKIEKEWDLYKTSLEKEIKSKSPKGKEILEEIKDFFPLDVGYDSKFDYLVFPFTSKTGRILAFTKRNRNEVTPQSPKWWHSNLEDSFIGSCHGIFNLEKSHEEISKTNEVYIVEGPRDVASMMRSGYRNTIAISGTCNFSENTLDILSGVKTVNFVMDGDAAGIKASKANIQILAKTSVLLLMHSHIINLPDGKDPGVMSKDEIDLAVSHKQKSLDWLIHNLDDSELKKFYIDCESDILKPKILNLFAKDRILTIYQAKEILNTGKKKTKKNPDIGYKMRLLSTIGKCEDLNVQPLNITEREARRILKLRYNENI